MENKRWVVARHTRETNEYLECEDYQGAPLWNSDPRAARRFTHEAAERIAARFASDVHACLGPRLAHVPSFEDRPDELDGDS